MDPLVALVAVAERIGRMMNAIFLMTKTTRSRQTQRRRKAARRRTEPLYFNGLGALVAGVVLWLLSIAMGTAASLKYASKALLAPAWMALGLGVGLLVLHVLSKRRAQAEATMLLRQHSTLLEPMPRLKPKSRTKPNFARSEQPSSAAGR